MAKQPARRYDRTAPWYSIPAREIILNPPRQDASINLFLCPEDGMSRPLSSTCNPANNILLKITVPKKTGRKRKRGSDEPFADDPNATEEDSQPASSTTTTPTPSRALTARDLLRRLQDNVGRYEVEAVGRVERMHVFRGMPDFVYSTTSSPFMTKFREKVLPFQYDKLKEFQFDMTKGSASNVDIIPPPALSRGDVPFNYLYRQNPTVKQSIGPSGEITTTNTQQIVKVLTHLVACDIPSVPTAPRENCPPIHTLDKALQETIATLQSLFESRVAWTRRGLRNHLTTNEQKYALRLAVPPLARRHCEIRPRSARPPILVRISDIHVPHASIKYHRTARQPEPGHRQYTCKHDNNNLNIKQTPNPPARLHHPRRPRSIIENWRNNFLLLPSHIFTGHAPLPRDGKMWMICDITDPILARLLKPPSSPSPSATPTPISCDIFSSGWYGNVTLAVAKTIMRAKIQYLLEYGTTPPAAMEEDFLPLLEFPERVGGDEEVGRKCIVGGGGGAAAGADGRRVSSRCMTLAAEVRAMVRGAPGRKVFLERGRGGEAGRGGGGEEKRVKWEDEVEVGDASEGEGEGEGDGKGEEEMGEFGEEEGEEGKEDEEADEVEGEEEEDRDNLVRTKTRMTTRMR
ncbi:hypothetical protein ACJ72_06867 [Emergomyces africanus]|uniref:Transcription factor IIIC subunit Tfc1/Sfc1 triple barrel domain-containing protein n=1 Tax=Emergomyces africanus TaxID=1955775 RepID=A0A1B7NPT2_9EURO|nr:hypothetical protein ACJ72_06867 [Emergomyces africanus]